MVCRAVGVGVLGDGDVIEGFDGGCRLAEGGAEGGEVMLADQVVGGGLHGVGIKGVADLPDEACVMGDGGTAGDEAEEVVAFAGAEAGVEIIGDFCDGGDGDGQGAQVGVDGARKAVRIPIAVKVAVGDLTCGMHACIGAACALDDVIAGLQAGQGGLYRRLHSGLAAGLALPAIEWPAVIVDFQGITRHMQGVADGAWPCNGQHWPRATAHGMLGRHCGGVSCVG
jgi:hypothetical protein